MMKTTCIAFALALLVSCAEKSKDAITPAEVVVASDTSSGAEFKSLTLNEDTSQWWKNAIFYEIWPRSFYDADGDGSGDFNGMTAKLSYLKELGVTGIWLTPVFEAPSYHGYDFQDFYSVESDYGTMEDFEKFIAASHEQGIKVILDLVLNHISDGHEWFQKSAAKAPGFEDFFVWRKERPDGWGKAWSSENDPAAVWHWNETRKEYFYGAFGRTQPDVNLENPQVVAELNRLAAFWLDKGVDGFRLDAVRYAIEEGGPPLQADTKGTIDYWTSFTKYVKSVNPDALLVAEAWADLDIIGKYRDGGKGLDSAFDFDFGYVVIDILNPESSRSADFGTVDDSQKQGGREALWQNLKGRKASAPISFFAPFLTNHDQNRIMHTLNGDTNKAKLAASLLMTSPGMLYLYYGEEIGLSQYKTGDDQFRRAIMQWSETDSAGFNNTGNFWLDQGQWFPWVKNHKGWWKGYWDSLRGQGKSVEAQMSTEGSLWKHYQALIKLRRENAALQFPEEIRYYPVDNADVWLVEYLRDGKSVWVVVNLSTTSTAKFSVPEALQGTHADQLAGGSHSLMEAFSLAPSQTLIF